MEPTDRRGDWEKSVDENRAALNTGQSDLYRNFRELRRQFTSLSHLVNGHPETHDPGFDARIEKIEDSLRRLNATMWADPTGSKGLVAEFRALQEGRQEKRDLRGDIVKIVIAVISSGTVGLFWHDIRAYFLRKSTDPVDQLIEKTKHPKGRNLHVVVRQQRSEPSEEQRDH